MFQPILKLELCWHASWRQDKIILTYRLEKTNKQTYWPWLQWGVTHFYIPNFYNHSVLDLYKYLTPGVSLCNHNWRLTKCCLSYWYWTLERKPNMKQSTRYILDFFLKFLTKFDHFLLIFDALRGYCTTGPYFWRLCAFSQKIKQLRTKYPMDLVRNVPRNSKITVLLQ